MMFIRMENGKSLEIRLEEVFEQLKMEVILVIKNLNLQDFFYLDRLGECKIFFKISDLKKYLSETGLYNLYKWPMRFMGDIYGTNFYPNNKDEIIYFIYLNRFQFLLLNRKLKLNSQEIFISRLAATIHEFAHHLQRCFSDVEISDIEKEDMADYFSGLFLNIFGVKSVSPAIKAKLYFSLANEKQKNRKIGIFVEEGIGYSSLNKRARIINEGFKEKDLKKGFLKGLCISRELASKLNQEHTLIC
jgi:hypothetical protein